jgi:hypothetical protein
MLEELNIMKLNFEVKHRFDFSGTLTWVGRIWIFNNKIQIVKFINILPTQVRNKLLLMILRNNSWKSYTVL